MEEPLDVRVLLDEPVGVAQFLLDWLVRLDEFGVESCQVPRVHGARRHAPVAQNGSRLRECHEVGIAASHLCFLLSVRRLGVARGGLVRHCVLRVLLRWLRLPHGLSLAPTVIVQL